MQDDLTSPDGAETKSPVDVPETLSFAAMIADISEEEVLRRATLHLFGQWPPRTPPPDPPVLDPWQPVAVHCHYRGTRVDGEYVPGSQRLTVTSGPLAGNRFRSPSGAARAVVAELNPARKSTTNGWRFWRATDTDLRLDSYRIRRG